MLLRTDRVRNKGDMTKHIFKNSSRWNPFGLPFSILRTPVGSPSTQLELRLAPSKAFSNNFGIVLGVFWDNVRIILGSLWDRFGIFSGKCWNLPLLLSGLWPLADHGLGGTREAKTIHKVPLSSLLESFWMTCC